MLGGWSKSNLGELFNISGLFINLDELTFRNWWTVTWHTFELSDFAMFVSGFESVLLEVAIIIHALKLKELRWFWWFKSTLNFTELHKTILFQCLCFLFFGHLLDKGPVFADSMRGILFEFWLTTQLNKVFSWDSSKMFWEEASDGIVFEVSFI